ncbi:MAG: hypothetical protein ACLQJR_33990 [Stellaceae bacterium]
MAYRFGPTVICALALLTAAPALAVGNPANPSETDRFAQLRNQGDLESTRPGSKALAQALDHLELAIVDARTASGSAFKAFAALGIRTFDPVTSRVKSAREVLYEMSERFAATRDDATKGEIAQVMLGPGWAALMPYLNKGPAGIKELEEGRE